jgi:hypothetical protein
MLVKKEKVEVQKSRSRDGGRDGDDGEDERSEQKIKKRMAQLAVERENSHTCAARVQIMIL